MSTFKSFRLLKPYISARPWLSSGLLTGWSLLIFALSSVPGNHYPQVDWIFADKLVHVGLYFWLGIFSWLYFEPRGTGLLSIFLIGIVFGISDEVHQRWVPKRSPSFSDVMADACGVALAIGVVYFGRRFFNNSERGSNLIMPTQAEGIEVN